jgi:TRAP-type uncharacterized transport system fused permease subunit
MPYERLLIYDLFDSNDISDLLPSFNQTYFDLYFKSPNKYNKEKCDEYQDRLDDNNNKLFDYCIYYLISINILLFLLFINDIYQNYSTFTSTSQICISPSSKNSVQSNSSSSLMAFRSSQNIADYKKNDNDIEFQVINTNEKKDKDTVDVLSKNETYFIIYYFKKSELIKEINKLLQFIILVGIFEYIFFIFIINKYKIANINTIICKIITDLIS